MTGTPDALLPFNRPHMTGRELHYISQAHSAGHLSGDGQFTRACSAWLEERTGASRALLTHSCTAALEMAALLLDLGPGDEVIMPSFTFVSTANAFALRGAIPVFVDIRPDTLNLDERLIEAAITERTRAICVVHYAGVAAEMDTLMAIAERHGLAVVEDAAQALLAAYRGRPLGTIGDLGTLSFHETKNVICGEGGALLCRDADLVGRAEIVREKGTDRSRFARGQVDKYSWVGIGSSYLPGEITAAFLRAQLEEAEAITRRRRAIWDRYHLWAGPLEAAGYCRRPIVPPHVRHNGHMFYLLLPTRTARDEFIAGMRERGIMTVFHYVPLHSSGAGARLGRAAGPLPVTNDVSGRLVRLPLWLGVEDEFERITTAAEEVLRGIGAPPAPTVRGLRWERLAMRHADSLRRLRNKAAVRVGFRDDAEVSAEKQQEWARTAVARTDEITWVLVDEADVVRGAVALCHIDHEAREAECARLMLDPDCADVRGLGAGLIRHSALAAQQLGLASVWAFVKAGNVASLRSFARAGAAPATDRSEPGMAYFRLDVPTASEAAL